MSPLYIKEMMSYKGTVYMLYGVFISGKGHTGCSEGWWINIKQYQTFFLVVSSLVIYSSYSRYRKIWNF